MKSILFIVIGIFICAAILLGVWLVNKNQDTKSQQLYSRSVSQVSRNKPTESCKQFPLAEGCGVVGAPLNICAKHYPNYPPPYDISTKTDPNVGTYTGTITNVDPHLHAITVTSDSNRNSFVFNGGSINGKIFDVHNTLITNFYTLRTGVKVAVSFSCTQKNGYFILTRFQLVQ